MLPELLELILLDIDINTTKAFSLTNHYFNQLIRSHSWWEKRTRYDKLIITVEVCDIGHCQLASHQHHLKSIKNYTISQWINYYHESRVAKTNAINTLLVYQIELSINPGAVINISFNERALLPSKMENDLCKYMLAYKIIKLRFIKLTLNATGCKVSCYCLPTSFEFLYKYLNPELTYILALLTIFYNDPNAIITNEKSQYYKNTKIWKIAEYLGKIII